MLSGRDAFIIEFEALSGAYASATSTSFAEQNNGRLDICFRDALGEKSDVAVIGLASTHDARFIRNIEVAEVTGTHRNEVAFHFAFHDITHIVIIGIWLCGFLPCLRREGYGIGAVITGRRGALRSLALQCP